MSATGITVGDDGKPDGFSLDLRDYREPSRRRRQRRGFYEPADPFERNSTPLDHYLIATAPCTTYASEADDVEGCRARRWAEHMSRCERCRVADMWTRIVAFEREHHDELEAIREERAALLEWARRQLARSGS